LGNWVVGQAEAEAEETKGEAMTMLAYFIPLAVVLIVVIYVFRRHGLPPWWMWGGGGDGGSSHGGHGHG
jgi:hypothetical protein